MRAVLTTCLEVLGLAAITTGATFIFWPAGLIVGGVGLVALGVALA